MLACQAGSLPVASQLYLPKEWAEDPPRRQKAGVPRDVEFATKPAIALAQIERLIAQGAPRHCLLADAGYGVDTGFRERLGELGLPYVVGVTGQVTVWPPGHEPLPPGPYSRRGNVPSRQRLRDAKHQRPLSVKELAFDLPAERWQAIEWREGARAPTSP
jgi:SRSO17 transposase